MGKKKKIDFSSLDFDFDSVTLGGEEDDAAAEKEFIKAARLNLRPVTWENAEDAAKAIDYTKDYFAFTSGRFVFGDFIEALCYVQQLLPEKVYVTTLGMGRENIDSLVNIAGYLGCKQLNLIVSNYFIAMERNKLVPYMVREFTGLPIDVAVLASHCKLCLIDSPKGKLIMAGSANLSSSNNVEQIMLWHDDLLFKKMQSTLDSVMSKFCILHGESGQTIFENNKNNTGKKAFEEVAGGINDGS